MLYQAIIGAKKEDRAYSSLEEKRRKAAEMRNEN